MKKNLGHIESQLNQLKQIPQRFFDEIDHWTNSAKSQLNELADHVEDAEWINFDMLEPKSEVDKKNDIVTVGEALISELD